MIDALAIIFSTVFVVYVVLRAYVANRTEPWFKATPATNTQKDEKTGRRHLPSTYRRP